MLYLRRLLPFFLGILLVASACKKKRDLSTLEHLTPFRDLSSDAVVLAFTSNLEGYVAPCGCTADPLGGIARFSQVFEDIRLLTNNRITLIDAGNLLFDSPTRHPADLCQDNARIELLLSTLTKLGLKTTVRGGFDNARGTNYRTDWYEKFNLQDLGSSEKISLKLWPVNGFTIALIALPNQENFDPLSLRENIQELLRPSKKEKNIKLVIVLSQVPTLKVKELFAGMGEVDLIIQGNSLQTALSSPIKIDDNGPWLFEGGRQGQYFTTLVLQNFSHRTGPITLDNRIFENAERVALLKTRIKGLEAQIEKSPLARASFLKQKIGQAAQELVTLSKNQLSLPPLKETSVSFNAISLTRTIEGLPEIKERLVKYENAIPELVNKCEENIECPLPLPGAAHFVGSESCKSCHQQAYEVWQKAQFMSEAVDENGRDTKRLMGHSKAWKTLVEAKKDSDRSCIGCHSIGFMQQGGYCKASGVDFRKDVQCESCHGAGSLHAATGDKKLIQQPTEQTCRTCHHVPHIQSYESFSYEERLMKILGPGHGQKLLERLKLKAH